ncbi:MAG: amidohydrolase family protein [Phycisphaerae bacterium]
MNITAVAKATATAVSLLIGTALAAPRPADDAPPIAIRGRIVYTMAGPPITDGVVLVRDGKIAAVGPAAGVAIPPGMRVLTAAVVTPGLIDAHTVVGLSGIYNQKQDQDQLEHADPIQPQLRAIDAYNTRDKLVAWIRGFGVTTVHTGHAPGELISGQTMIVKTTGNTVEDAVIVETAAVAATLGPWAQKSDKGKSPGTRGKMVAMLRQQFIKAVEYKKKRADAPPDKRPDRDLKLDVLVRVLDGDLPLIVTANRAQDIETALRLAREFHFTLWLDMATEAYLLIDQIKAAGVPVIIHPTMYRAFRETENLSFETAARLKHAGIRVAMQGGYESYVPKVRVVLFEAALAAANGLSGAEALATITIDAARILGIDDRVGSLEVGKDGDIALYDGDPFEYTSHCIGVLIDGRVVHDTPR